MLNRSASLAMSTSILKALPGKLNIKRHSPSILYVMDRSHGRQVMGQIFLYLLSRSILTEKNSKSKSYGFSISGILKLRYPNPKPI